MNQTLRIRSDATNGAWIEAHMRGSWEVVYGTDTKGDIVKVKAWVRDTAPDSAEDVIDEFDRWSAENDNDPQQECTCCSDEHPVGVLEDGFCPMCIDVAEQMAAGDI